MGFNGLDGLGNRLAGGWTEGIVPGRGSIARATGKAALHREAGGNSAIRESVPQPIVTRQAPEVVPPSASAEPLERHNPVK